MDEEFEEFFESQIRKMHTGYSGMKAAWLESARRADRRAREECAEICRNLEFDAIPGSMGDGFCGPLDCDQAIRATIQED